MRIWNRSSPRFGDEGIRCTWLETSHAFHSELLDPVLDEFESYAAQLEFAVPTLPLVCNRTGAVLTAQTPLDAQYWRRHSRQPVQFAESVRTVAALGCSVLMEIGPQPVLTAAAVQVWPEHLAAPRAIVSLRKGVGDRRQIAEALAAAYVGGHRPDFAALHRQPGADSNCPPIRSSAAASGPRLPGIDSSGIGVPRCPESWAAQRISPPATPSTPAGCPSNRSRGCPITSSTAPSSFPVRRMRRWRWPRSAPPARVKDVFFYEPIILREKASREVQLTLHPLEDGGGWTFTGAQPPVRRARCRVVVERRRHRRHRRQTTASGRADGRESDPVDAAIERLNRTRPQDLFETFADMELAWGPTWSSSLKSLWVGEGEAIGDIVVGEELAEHLGSEPMHPVLLDLCTGVAFPAFPALLAAEQGVPRSVPAAAVRAGDAAGEDAAAVLLPRDVARQRRSTAKPRSSTSISSIGMAASWAESASSR